jgi:hypothetical protein
LALDLIRLLRSLEEFLYELVGWLVFYPRTFWRIFRHPGRIARYTRTELTKDRDDQFADTISPVLMLILSVIFTHVLELAFKAPVMAIASPIGQKLFGSEQGLLLTRSVAFCIYALGAALGTLRAESLEVTRNNLREPFSIQAFLVCPFLLLLSVGSLVARTNDLLAVKIFGVAIAASSAAWYVLARAAAYRALFESAYLRAFVRVLLWFVATTAAILLVLVLFAGKR